MKKLGRNTYLQSLCYASSIFGLELICQSILPLVITVGIQEKTRQDFPRIELLKVREKITPELARAHWITPWQPSTEIGFTVISV